MKKHGRYESVKPPMAGWKKFLIVVLCILLLFAAMGASVYFYIESKLKLITQAQFEDKGTSEDLELMAGVMENTEPPTLAVTEPVTTEPETTVPEATEQTEPTEPDYGTTGKIVNIMVVGQDYRVNIEEHRLADTIMLFTLNKETKQLTVTSFLRDSYVDLPDYYRGHTCGWNRINTSYALGYGWFGTAGAMDMLNVTIKDNFGVEVDGNVEIDMDSFVTVVDILGGVDIVLSEDETKYMNSEASTFIGLGYKEEWNLQYYEVGENHLTGHPALWYAMMRHASASDSDVHRTERQRLIVDKLLEKCKQMSLLQLNNLLDEVLPSIVTNISTDDMKVYIKELLPYVFELELVQNQCPAPSTYWGEMVDLPDGPGGVLKMDFYQNKKLLMEICEAD